MPGRANSAYASSTITMPGADSTTTATMSNDSAVPVGLFGEQRNTTSGACSRTCATTSDVDSPKSAPRRPSIHRVPVPAASSGCIE